MLRFHNEKGSIWLGRRGLTKPGGRDTAVTAAVPFAWESLIAQMPFAM